MCKFLLYVTNYDVVLETGVHGDNVYDTIRHL